MNFLKNKRRAEGRSAVSRNRRKFLSGAAGARCGSARLPDGRERPDDADCDALAEHLAGEGHLSRVRHSTSPRRSTT